MRVITTTIFAAILMLWCAQTMAYTGQCHTAQGNPYIGVNFGVKTRMKKKIRPE